MGKSVMHDPKVTNSSSTIDHILECAATLNWSELTLEKALEGMQIEYRTGADGALECLKVWTSATRGHWRLVCEYWMHSSDTHTQGITYSNSYSSVGLSSMLQAIMQNQTAFMMPSREYVDGLVQIPVPSETGKIAARTDMVKALERINQNSSGGSITVAMKLAADH
jgi:hypothetical protein